MTNRLQPAYQAGIKGDKGTSTKALKQLTEKDYKLHRGSATEVFSRAVIPAQPKTLTANIDRHPSDSPVTAKLKERWSHLAKASPSYAIVQLDPSGQNHHTHDTLNQLGSPDDAEIVVSKAVREIPSKGVVR